jgi:hypothetical protein
MNSNRMRRKMLSPTCNITPKKNSLFSTAGKDPALNIQREAQRLTGRIRKKSGSSSGKLKKGSNCPSPTRYIHFPRSSGRLQISSAATKTTLWNSLQTKNWATSATSKK